MSEHVPVGSSGSCDESSGVRPGASGVPPGVVRHAGGLVRFVCTHNPFYLISAVLVLWGLRISFSAGHTHETLLLAACMAGYTLLMAAAAWFLIRIVGAWQDTRTILLVVVLMFLAMSVTFEETLVAAPRLGIWCCSAGLVFAIGLTESLLRGIRLSLPVLLRIPLYLILSLFFLYPIALVSVVDQPFHPGLQWGLFGFGCTGGLLLLFLLPAARRGPRYVADNGSPWPWPQYPWSLFGLLVLGLCGRCYLLCMSLHPERGDQTVFGAYFLVPILMPVCLLLLEIGIVARRRWILHAALAAPLGLLGLTVTGPVGAAGDLGFLDRFVNTLHGSPLFFTVIATVAFHAWAGLRRVPGATTALTASLAMLAILRPDSVPGSPLAAPHWLPLAAVALLQACIALSRPSTARYLLATCCLVAAMSVAFGGTVFTAHGGLIPLHLLGAAVLILGATFDDALARVLRYSGAVLIVVAGIGALTIGSRLLDNPHGGLLVVYCAATIAVAAGYWYVSSNRWYLAAASVNLIGWAAVSGWHLHGWLRPKLVGANHIAAGLLCFLLALLISLIKAEMPQRWLAQWRDKRQNP